MRCEERAEAIFAEPSAVSKKARSQKRKEREATMTEKEEEEENHRNSFSWQCEFVFCAHLIDSKKKERTMKRRRNNTNHKPIRGKIR
jgi:hypothetical protein